MKRITGVVAVLSLTACAHLGMPDAGARERSRLWEDAHLALASEDFSRARVLFQRLADDHLDSQEGRESVFFLGAMRLDPRNPEWEPVPAERRLAAYLAIDSAGPPRVSRQPEARTLLELAKQLNMPSAMRVPGLQSETRVVVEEPERVVVRAGESRALAQEVERLRAELTQRDAQIQQQREEIERIRRTLSGRQ